MAMTPRQYQESSTVLDCFQATVVFASTAAAASSTVTSSTFKKGGVAYIPTDIQIGDIVDVSLGSVSQLNASVTANVTAQGSAPVITFTVANPTGGTTFNPGTITVNLLVRRIALI